MPGLGTILEVTTLLAALAKLALFTFSILRSNGPAWSAFRWNIFFSMIGAMGAAFAIAHIDFSQYGWASTAGIAIVVVCIGRVGQSITAFILAAHLMRMSKYS